MNLINLITRTYVPIICVYLLVVKAECLHLVLKAMGLTKQSDSLRCGMLWVCLGRVPAFGVVGYGLGSVIALGVVGDGLARQSLWHRILVNA